MTSNGAGSGDTPPARNGPPAALPPAVKSLSLGKSYDHSGKV